MMRKTQKNTEKHRKTQKNTEITSESHNEKHSFLLIELR